MSIHSPSLREGLVKISLTDAANLSEVANRFGVRSSREARWRPGGFNLPIVGNNPNYYVQEAGKIVLQAVKADKTLTRHYALAGSLNRTLSILTDKPNAVGVRLTETAADLLEVSKQIDQWYAENDLQLPLDGKWLERACNISAFALREVTGTNQEEHTTGEMDGNIGFFSGIPQNNPINSVEYWNGLYTKLQPEA